MPSTTGKSLEQLKQMKKDLESQGKEASTSKSLGKVIDAIKVLEPHKYSSGQVAQATAKLASSTQPATAGGSSGLGSNGLSGSGSSGTNLNDIYNTAINDPALLSLQAEMDKKKTDLNTALAGINDNPYYAEATRVGKVNKLNEIANNDINTLQTQISEKKADAQVKVNIASQQYNIDSAEYQKQISKLNLLISSGAIVNATSSDISNIALATGMSTAEIKGIITQTKAGQRKLQTATDNNGNVTVYDLNTGQVVSTINGVDKTKTSSTTTKTPDTNKYLSQATKYIAGADIAYTGGDSADKLLSKAEGLQAYQQILALVGGDTELADEVFNQAMNAGGYGKYGSW